MALKVLVTRDLDVTIMEMSGTVTLGVGSVTYREAVREAIWNGHLKFAIDYGNISYQDSSGNGELVASFTLVRNYGGELVLFDITKRIQDMFRVTKLYTCFRIYDSRASALAYMESTRTTKMKVTERRFSGVSVLAIEGALTQEGWRGPGVSSATQAALDAGAESVILQCRQVLDVDSIGVGDVMLARRHVAERGGELVLAGVEERLKPALSRAGVFDALPIYDSIDGAFRFLKLEVDWKKSRPQVIRAG